MLAVEAIQLTKAAASELRAQGQEARAEALERLLTVATVALGGPQAGPPAYLTAAQAARLLGGSPRQVKELVDRGALQAELFGSRLLISHDALVAYFASVGAEPISTPAPSSAQLTERKRLHQHVVKGLPADAVARQEALHDKIESGERLTRSERAELSTLERDLVSAAATRLEHWIEQSGDHKS